MIAGLPKRKVYEEKLYIAQLNELEKDDEKAKKFPQLRGKTLSDTQSGRLKSRDIVRTEAERNWYKSSISLESAGWIQRGIVSKMKKTKKGIALNSRRSG